MTSFKEVSAADVNRLNEEGGQINLIDVRTPEEFSEVHASMATSLPLDRFSAASVEGLGLDHDDMIYIICRSGSRSAQACSVLADAGFKYVHNVSGGTLDWVGRGFPVTFRKDHG